MYQKFGKRFLDILLSACGILVLSPVYLLVALAIKIDDPGPVFFRQKRVGIHKTHFQILKFRTMKMDTPILPPKKYNTAMGIHSSHTSFSPERCPAWIRSNLCAPRFWAV